MILFHVVQLLLAKHRLFTMTLFLTFAVLTLGMGSQNIATKDPMSLETLHAYLGLPAECSPQEPVWVGRNVTIWGYLDSANIFDHQRYPQLPYEKFKLIDRQGRSVEIWPQAKNNGPIFAKLTHGPGDKVSIRGRLAAFNMPVTGHCTLGVKVFIDNEQQIEFIDN